MTVFQKNIKSLHFQLKQREKEGGILFTKDFPHSAKFLEAQVVFALETASHFEADAVYFRYFEGGRAAVPQLYFFDFTAKAPTDEDFEKIHIRMWNGNQVPAYLIVEKATVRIFDARVKPALNQPHYAREIITLVGDAMAAFNAASFDSGLFWEENNNDQSHFAFEQSATRDLIRGLKEVYKSFKEHSDLDAPVALKLLVQSLLIKYLEERDEDTASGYFAGTYFKKNFQCQNFCDTIRQGKLLDLLDQLASDFNGRIFEWNKVTEKKERTAIRKVAVKKLADYLDGDIVNNQYVIWRLYSFSHLPVEVISSVYEELLTNSKDIVYTPEMIVSTLVDECMPLAHPKSPFKLIDVSCGSGIFLVKAFKRLVQWWRYEQYQQTGKLIRPPLSVLKDLLLKSIHGIDIQREAIHLSIFSLALAMLDEVNLDPPTWGKLRFVDMSENVITQDFFHYISASTLPVFDLVIGNPPFNLKQENGKEISRKKHFEHLHKNFGYRPDIVIPDEHPALHFLVQSVKLLSPGALLCMIQPTGPLLYQKNVPFKKSFFSRVNLLQVIDFTKLADKLWGKANVATGAIFLQRSLPDDQQVLHLVACRNFSNRNRLFLEFDNYDFHYVNREDVTDNPGIWKANLLGGGRVAQLTMRLAMMPTLGDYLIQQKHERQWIFGEGFIKGKPDSELVDSDFEKKKGGYKAYPYLNNSQCVKTEEFTEDGIGETYTLKGTYYQWGRSKELFEPPLLLIKNGIGKKRIPTYFSDEPLSYRDRIFGIHAPDKDRTKLQAIDAYLNANADVLRFYIAATSAEVLVNRATAIFTEDILHIPYLPQHNKPLISVAEQLLIDDILKHYLNVFNEELFQPAPIKCLTHFGTIFCKTLNSVYNSNGRSFQAIKILETKSYWAMHFMYSEQKIDTTHEVLDMLEKYIDVLIPAKNSSKKSLYIQRIMKLYGQDTIILAKPKQLRYWLPSIAIRDADNSFADLVKAGY